MASPKGLKKSQVRDALINNGGLVTQAAMHLGCQPSNVQAWMDRHPDLKALRKVHLEELKDHAEATLFKEVKAGDKDWTKYFLDHHARDRGYGQKLNLLGKDDAPLFDPAAFAAFLSGLTDDQRKAFDVLRGAAKP